MKGEKTRIRYALELSRYIKGFGIYLLAAIACNMMFKVLPLILSLVTSYLISSVLLGDTSRVLQLLTAAGVASRPTGSAAAKSPHCSKQAADVVQLPRTAARKQNRILSCLSERQRYMHHQKQLFLAA